MLAARTDSPLRVGCSGWVYKDWRGKFYPEQLPQSRWLEYYVTAFNTVEINSSFYRLPDAGMFREWRRQMPRGFECATAGARREIVEGGPGLQVYAYFNNDIDSNS